MDLKRIAAALLVAAVPTLITTPAAYADDASEGGPVLDFGRPDSDESAAQVEVAGATEVAGVIFSGGVEVAGVQVGQLSDPEYLSRVVAYPQPAIRVQPGMVSLRSLQRSDSLSHYSR